MAAGPQKITIPSMYCRWLPENKQPLWVGLDHGFPTWPGQAVSAASGQSERICVIPLDISETGVLFYVLLVVHTFLLEKTGDFHMDFHGSPIAGGFKCFERSPFYMLVISTNHASMVEKH